MSDFDAAEPYKTPTSDPATSTGFDHEQRQWALIAHLVPLTGYLFPLPLLNVIAPAIVWFLKREEMPFVDEQAKEAINFQILMTIFGVISFILAFFIIGFFLLMAIVVVNLIYSVLAAKAAQEGKHYRYPFSLRLI